MSQSQQKYLAEVFGTFTLVFVGATTVVGVGIDGAPLFAPFAFGLGLLAALYAFGEISGGHFNPAVSLGLFLDRRLSVKDLIAYWISQVAGGILGALALLLMTSSDDVGKAATVPGSHGDRAAFFAELFLTAVFVLVILQVTKSGKYGSTTFVAIALTLMAVHFAAVPFSGSGVNPARSFATALVGTEWKSFWIYILAPLAGAILGWLVHSVVVKGKTDFRGDIDEMRKEVGGAMGGAS
jgi:aquaporin Z